LHLLVSDQILLDLMDDRAIDQDRPGRDQAKAEPVPDRAIEADQLAAKLDLDPLARIAAAGVGIVGIAGLDLDPERCAAGTLGVGEAAGPRGPEALVEGGRDPPILRLEAAARNAALGEVLGEGRARLVGGREGGSEGQEREERGDQCPHGDRAPILYEDTAI